MRLNIDKYNNFYEYVENLSFLGCSLSKEQITNIRNGSFKDMMIGQFWEFYNVRYRIVSHDQFYGYNGIDKHHLVVMPETIYRLCEYDLSDTTTGYVGSNVFKFINEAYEPYITAVFGEDHILSHSHDLPGMSELITVPNVKAWLPNSYNTHGYSYPFQMLYDWQDTDKTQFPAFAYDIELRETTRLGYADKDSWWLSTIVPHSEDMACMACCITKDGVVCYSPIKSKLGVRPVFLVC